MRSQVTLYLVVIYILKPAAQQNLYSSDASSSEGAGAAVRSSTSCRAVQTVREPCRPRYVDVLRWTRRRLCPRS